MYDSSTTTSSRVSDVLAGCNLTLSPQCRHNRAASYPIFRTQHIIIPEIEIGKFISINYQLLMRREVWGWRIGECTKYSGCLMGNCNGFIVAMTWNPILSVPYTPTHSGLGSGAEVDVHVCVCVWVTNRKHKDNKDEVTAARWAAGGERCKIRNVMINVVWNQ